MSAPSPITKKYTNVAFLYDTWTRFTERTSLHEALERANIRDGESILEVAVGTGGLFEKLLGRNPSGRNVGIDLTEAMLRRARRKAERTGAPFELHLADARKLPFEDGRFDLVFNNNMLGLVPGDVGLAIVREMFRVLRPSGRIVLVMMMRPSTGLGSLVYEVGAVRLGGWREVDVEPMLREAGFVELERQSVTQLGITSRIVLARHPEIRRAGDPRKGTPGSSPAPA